MITPADGKYCPHCYAYMGPWPIRSMIAKGYEKFECKECGFSSYIEDLIDADTVRE